PGRPARAYRLLRHARSRLSGSGRPLHHLCASRPQIARHPSFGAQALGRVGCRTPFPEGASVHFHHLNLLAVLVAAVSTMVVGFLWYSPVLFARPWMREMGWDPDDRAKMRQMQSSAGPAYLGSFVASLLSAFVLALFFHWMRVGSVHAGLGAAFHVWLGFVATVQFTGALFQKQSMKLLAINTGYPLGSYLAVGGILGAWI